MILPIISYGHNILRQKGKEIDPAYPDLDALISNMWETMYGANGGGLAAPQVNKSIRLFIVDSVVSYKTMDEDERKEFFDGDTGIKETFINARIMKYSEETWPEDEGCLSVPKLYEEVERSWSITIEYFDRNFAPHTKEFHGTTARIIQHEFDHTEGKLYLDYLKPITRRLLEGKLKKIAKGELKGKYPMK
jgi:peptide deformylase